MLNINESVIILIKDGDPLCVDRQRLTKASPVFKRLIEELSFYEIEMDDFEADTVGVFLAILEEEKAEDFEKDQFREIHKMSVVFEVLWLQKSCRSWLSGKIKRRMGNIEKLYVFEECLFILRKWEETDLMDMLITKIMPDDNTQFIMEYLKDLKRVDSIQIDLMLQIGGRKVESIEMFLKIILKYLENETKLEKNVKYLLQKFDLAMCFEELNELYTHVLDAIRNLRDITVEDLRFVVEISSKIMKVGYEIYQSQKDSGKTQSTVASLSDDYHDDPGDPSPLEYKSSCRTQ